MNNLIHSIYYLISVSLVFIALSLLLIFLFHIKKICAVIIGSALFSVYYFLYNEFQIQIFIFYSVFFLILTILSVEDIKNRYVNDWQLIILLLSAILIRLFINIPILMNAMSIVLAFSILFIAYVAGKKKGIGLGDVITLTIAAIIFTPVEFIIVFILTTLSATLFGAINIIITRKNKKDDKKAVKIPLIPFIQFAMFIFIPFKSQFLQILKLENIYNMQFLLKG